MPCWATMSDYEKKLLNRVGLYSRSQRLTLQIFYYFCCLRLLTPLSYFVPLWLIIDHFDFMASLQFKVVRKPAILVAPSLPTPREFLYLSNIDDQATLRFYTPAVFFYRFNPSKMGEDPARVIREGLAKVLVFYYPFAGRVKDAPAGKLVVECTGEGALFVEADADVTLEEFGDLQPSFPCWQDLLHDVPDSQTITKSPLLLIQVKLFIL